MKGKGSVVGEVRERKERREMCCAERRESVFFMLIIFTRIAIVEPYI
jgi:hypothetical protein